MTISIKRITKTAGILLLGSILSTPPTTSLVNAGTLVHAATTATATTNAAVELTAEPATPDYKTILATLRTNLDNTLSKTDSNTKFFKNAYEWSIFSLARDLNATSVPEVYANYIADITTNLKQTNGLLYTEYEDGYIDYKQPTDYDKLILALTAAGADATDFDGINLFDSIPTFKKITSQGINGVDYTLLALNAKENYAPSKNADYSTDSLVDYIISQQKDNGGWTMWGKGADSDVTSMTLQALAPYQADAAVKKAIDKGLALLSTVQSETGGYYMAGSATPVDNANSVSQVITTLATLGISPTSPEFTKNGISALDNLLSFYVPETGFKYLQADTRTNGMATTQAYYSLTAFERSQNGKNGLFSMDDAQSTIAGAENPNSNEDNNNSENNSNNEDNSGSTEENTTPTEPVEPEQPAGEDTPSAEVPNEVETPIETKPVVETNQPQAEAEEPAPTTQITSELPRYTLVTTLIPATTSQAATKTAANTTNKQPATKKEKKKSSNWQYSAPKFKEKTVKKAPTKAATSTKKQNNQTPLLIAAGLGLLVLGLGLGYFFGFSKGKSGK